MQEESKNSINQLKELMKDDPKTEKRFIRVKEGVKLYNMGKTKFMQIARDAGALYKIERTCLIDVEVFEEYLNTFRVPGEFR